MLTRACPCDSPAVVKRRGMRKRKLKDGAGEAALSYSATSQPPIFSAHPRQSGRSRLDIVGSQVDDDEPLLAHRVNLHDDVGRVAGHWTTRTERAINRRLELKSSATDVVGDIYNLDLSGRRANEREPLVSRRQRAVRIRVERDA